MSINHENDMNIQVKLPNKSECPDLDVGDLITHLIPNKLTVHDRQLYQTKWWDYRFMSPFEATFEFIDTFGQEARKIYSRDIDTERARYIAVVSGSKLVRAFLENDTRAKKSMSGFWRGRQVADALGMPYSVYIYEALSQRMRSWKRPYLPNEDQIYRGQDVERVAARWNEIAASRIFYSDHHAYMAQNYKGAPLQKDYYGHLVNRAEKTGDKIMTLVDMVEADRLSLEYLETDHPGIVDQVRASLR
jgi:glutathione S-transferase